MARAITERAHGPYRRGKKWRVVIVGPSGRRTTISRPSEAEANEILERYNHRAQGRTLSAVIDEYVKHRRTTDLRSTTLDTLEYRLHGLLRDVERDRLLTSVTPKVAAEMYELRRAKVAVDTHRGELAAVTTMFAWCVERGWLTSNPFGKIDPVGKKNVRKAKLRIDEAREFLEVALAEKTSEGLAAALALLLGLRATEVTGLRVRDIDDGGRVLWIDETDDDASRDLKSEDSERSFEVPEILRERIAALCAKRHRNEQLFGDVGRHWLYYHVKRLCDAAKVSSISTHALRRTQSKISATKHSVEHVAAALGHASSTVTKRHYVGRGSDERRRAGVALQVLAGGKP